MNTFEQINSLVDTFLLGNNSIQEIKESKEFVDFDKATDQFISGHKKNLEELSVSTKLNLLKIFKDLLLVMAVKSAIDKKLKEHYLSSAKNQVESHKIADAWGQNTTFIKSLSELIAGGSNPVSYISEVSLLTMSLRQGLALSASELQIRVPASESNPFLSFSSLALERLQAKANDYSQLELGLSQYLDSL